jgi:hypothetical protein
MKITTLDPSIAFGLNIDPVAYEEWVYVYFNASENWTGDFEFSVYNSAQKNQVVKPVNALIVTGKQMQLLLKPSVYGLEPKAHYYEIVSVSTKRVIFKGILNIIK